MCASVARKLDVAGDLLPLSNGDRMTQKEFHRRYERYPEDIKIELVGGVVYMASPLSVEHSDYDEELGFLYGVYRRATPGTQSLRGATVILGEESEPQPDLGLRILSECGGQSRVQDRYLVGAAELLTEISVSTRAIDLHLKKADYQRAGACEYLVVSVEEPKLFWFGFKPRGNILPDEQGIYRSRVFPGLWIDGPALLARKSRRLMTVLRRGLRSPEHAAFVKKLAAAKSRGKR